MSQPVEPDKLFDPNGPDPATDLAAPEPTKSERSGLDAVLRLAAGGTALALNAVRGAVEPEAGRMSPALEAQDRADNGAQAIPQRQKADPTLRHILIGAAFETVDQVDQHVSAAIGRTRRLASPPLRWARKSRLTSPLRSSYHRLATRSAARLDRWQARGVAEEMEGQAILGTALDRSVDTTLDYVVDSPQVQGLMDELVAAESQALSERVLVELRGRLLSADLYAGHLFYSVLRHPSPQIPPPPRRIAFAGDTVTPPHLRGRTAGFVSRLTALMTDIVIISVLVRAAGWILDDVRLATGVQISLQELTETSQAASSIQLTALGGLLISITYLLFFWTMGGQTPGKALLGLRIVTRSGGRLLFWRSLVRFFGYWLSWLLFGMGFLWANVDNHREGLHDKLAGTSVVYAWDARPDGDILAGRIQNPDGS